MDFVFNFLLYLIWLIKKVIIFIIFNNFVYIDLFCMSDILESKILIEYKMESKL